MAQVEEREGGRKRRRKGEGRGMNDMKNSEGGQRRGGEGRVEVRETGRVRV